MTRDQTPAQRLAAMNKAIAEIRAKRLKREAAKKAKDAKRRGQL